MPSYLGMRPSNRFKREVGGQFSSKYLPGESYYFIEIAERDAKKIQREKCNEKCDDYNSRDDYNYGRVDFTNLTPKPHKPRQAD